MLYKNRKTIFLKCVCILFKISQDSHRVKVLSRRATVGLTRDCKEMN